MAEERKQAPLKVYPDRSHIFYDRDNDTAGRLIKVLLQINDGDSPFIDADIKDIVDMWSGDIKRQKEKYLKTCGVNQENANKRWEKDREEKALLAELLAERDNMRPHATAYDRIEPDADACHTDTDTDTDTNTKTIITSAINPKGVPYPKWTLEQFKRSVEEVIAEHPEYSCIKDKFIDYWTEPTPNGKLKFQAESSWATARRMSRWYGNERNKPAPSADTQPSGDDNVARKIAEWNAANESDETLEQVQARLAEL